MKKFLILFIMIGIIFSLVACGQTNQTSSNSDSKLAEIQAKGYISVGTSPDYAPFEFIIVEDGKEKIVGSDISIIEEIATDLGVELKIVEMNFSGLILELQNGNLDLVIAGFSPTEEREQVVDFSDIYYENGQSIVIRAEDAHLYTDVESLENQRIGVQSASLQESVAREQIANAKITTFEKLPNVVMDLRSGNIDIALIATHTAKGYVEQFPDLMIANIEHDFYIDGCAIAAQKGSQDLLEVVNTTILRLKNENLIDQFIIEAEQIAAEYGLSN